MNLTYSFIYSTLGPSYLLNFAYLSIYSMVCFKQDLNVLCIIHSFTILTLKKYLISSYYETGVYYETGLLRLHLLYMRSLISSFVSFIHFTIPSSTHLYNSFIYLFITHIHIFICTIHLSIHFTIHLFICTIRSSTNL